MKKLFVLLIATVFSAGLFANDSNINMVKTDNQTVFVKRIQVGIKTIKVTTFDGEKIKYDKSEVLSYIQNGHQFDRVKECSGKDCFMELIKLKNGYKVYKKEFCDADGEMTSRHMVYKDNEFVVQFTDANKANLIAFFNE